MNTDIEDRLLQKISDLEDQNEDLEKSSSNFLINIDKAISKTKGRKDLVEQLIKLMGA